MSERMRSLLTFGTGAGEYERKINLGDQLKGFYGQHRSGWVFAVSNLRPLHTSKGVHFDCFIERTFCWHPDGVAPTLKPWVGFIHIPPNVPKWFQYEQSNDFIFQTDAWKKSAPYCRGLFTLTHYHRKNLETKLDIPVNHLFFPTETPEVKWNWEKFQANKNRKIVQVGWWLRKLHTIYQLPTKSYKKLRLQVTHADVDGLMAKERDILIKQGVFHDDMYDTAETLVFIPDHEYDTLLSENLAIINLYDSSANNTVIECIVRNTPLLVNRLEPVMEYLGEDYPFYYSSLEEAAEKAEDIDLVYKTHRYLSGLPIKEKLTGDYFLDSFTKSEIYRNL